MATQVLSQEIINRKTIDSKQTIESVTICLGTQHIVIPNCFHYFFRLNNVLLINMLNWCIIFGLFSVCFNKRFSSRLLCISIYNVKCVLNTEKWIEYEPFTEHKKLNVKVGMRNLDKLLNKFTIFKEAASALAGGFHAGSLLNWIWKCSFLWRVENPENPGKNLRARHEI